MDAALIARMKAAANQLAVPLGAGPEGVALSPALCLLLREAIDALEAQVAPERPTYSDAIKQGRLDGTLESKARCWIRRWHCLKAAAPPRP